MPKTKKTERLVRRNGEARVVMTWAIRTQIENEQIENDNNAFAIHVYRSLMRFMRSDWGDTSKHDWKLNDQDYVALRKGEYGRILAVYGNIWIIEDSEAITILFPSDY